MLYLHRFSKLTNEFAICLVGHVQVKEQMNRLTWQLRWRSGGLIEKWVIRNKIPVLMDELGRNV